MRVGGQGIFLAQVRVRVEIYLDVARPREEGTIG